jgi:sec-independent protein translocase protein TatA
MFSMLEGPDLIVILLLVLVLFGGAQLPKLTRNLGEAQREFKKGLKGDSHDEDADDHDTDDHASASTHHPAGGR